MHPTNLPWIEHFIAVSPFYWTSCCTNTCIWWPLLHSQGVPDVQPDVPGQRFIFVFSYSYHIHHFAWCRGWSFFVFLILIGSPKAINLGNLGDVLTFLHFVPQVSNLSALLSFNLCFAPGACWSRGCSKGFSYFGRTSAVKQQCEGLGCGSGN